ncbi:MAG TPA: NADPH:quinone oxidoreductase family protein [Burkholderiales bacterium]|nr:NADPH:quinone oxidoreductase family protein [Burkholderiales bacterium]
MKAVVCKAWGPPESLVFEERPSLQAEPGKVLVSIRAANVKFSDMLIIQNKYQTKPDLPFIPGSEVSGVVKSVGAGVEGWKVGDRVAAQTGLGGYAEEVLAEPDRLLAIPQSVDFNGAAGLASTYGTSYHALIDRGQLRAGETLLVLGAAGGVGIAAVEIGKILGAKVIACASTDEKLAVCRAHGADETINYASEDLRARIKSITAGKGIDVVYDPVGGPYSELALREIAWGGRLLVIGFTAGDIPKIPLNLPLLKCASIVGVWIGSFAKRDPARHRANIHELWKWLAEGRIRPHVWGTYPLEKAADALNALAERKVAGKVLLTTGAAQ